MFGWNWRRKEGKERLDGSFMKSLSLQALPLKGDFHPARGNVNVSQKSGGIPLKICSKTKIKTKRKSIKQIRGRRGFRSSAHDGKSHLSVAAGVCINIHCPHLVVSYKKKTCCPAGSLLVGSDGWSQAYSWMVELLFFFLLFTSVSAPCSVIAAVLRLSHVLSHGVAMFGGLVGGCGLWRMGTGGQGVGDGHPPRHQPLHRSGDPTGGHAHHTRRESGEGQRMINRCDKRAKLFNRVTFSAAAQWLIHLFFSPHHKAELIFVAPDRYCLKWDFYSICCSD